MKTSNIILFTVMSSFSIIIIAGALELRIFGKLNDGISGSPNQVTVVDAHLEPFQFLVINESINVTIEKGDSLSFKVYRNQDDNAPLVKFHQSGDTLFIDQVAFGKDGSSLSAVIKLNDAKTLKFIHAINSTISMEDLDGNSLGLNLKSSRLYLTSNQKQLETLNVAAIDSYVSYDGGITGKMEANLDHSEVSIQGIVSEFSGTVKNESDLLLYNVNQITFKKDSTSAIRIMN